MVLKRKNDFETLKTMGIRVQSCRWFFVSYMYTQNSHSRISWTIPKYVGTAVVRNKLKRWCRVILHSMLSRDTTPKDINIIFYRYNKEFFKNVQFSDFQEKLFLSFKKIP